MRSTAELRVPMVPVAVEIAAAGAPPAPGEVYVPDVARAGRHVIADDLAVLLESEPPFLPVKLGAGVELMAKQAIHWLALATRLAGEDSMPPPVIAQRAAPVGDAVVAEVIAPEPSEVLTLFDSKHDVEITLSDGSTLAGAILHSSPADRPGRFVRLWTSRAQYLINKAHVARVREVG